MTKVPADMKYTQKLLREAMELLGDNYAKMGMFERQRYVDLKRRFADHEALNDKLRQSLGNIETER